MKEDYNTEIMIKAAHSGDFIEEIEDQKYMISALKSDLKKLEFNLKLIRNTPLLSQSARNAIKVWEEKNMEEFADSMFIIISGSFRGSKKSIRKKKEKILSLRIIRHCNQMKIRVNRYILYFPLYFQPPTSAKNTSNSK